MAGNRPEDSGASAPEPSIEREDPPVEATNASADVAERTGSAAGVGSGDASGPTPLPLTDEGELPDRYLVKPQGEDRRVLNCLESPNIVVLVERGLTVAATTARKSQSGTIFLDGAAREAPFLDTERHVYNLDHHEGCVRSFTLSTCEQAYIMVRKGLSLRERDWTVYANEPDLDTILAVWILINYRRLNDENPEIRQKILPLIRLEGVIDVHGLEMTELSCFPEELLEETSAMVSELMEEELTLKREGRWSEIDFAEYTADQLRKIDRLVYSPWHFDGFKVVDELARVEVTDSQIAVICRSDAGIYEVEQQLTKVHENRLGLIVLQKDAKSYTLRQVNLFLPTNLRRVYAQLNLIDPSAGKGGAENRWGGSADIGGSPRKTGTALSPAQIAEAILRAFHKPTPMQVLSTVAVATITTTIAVLLGWAILEFWEARPATFTTAFLVAIGVMLGLFARQYPRVFGLRIPTQRDWWWLLPIGLVGFLMGGGWIWANPSQGHEVAGWPLRLYVLLALPLSAELLFRGLIHGLFREELRAQRAGGRWFVSWPVIGSTTLYVAVSLLPFVPRTPGTELFIPDAWLPQGLWLTAVHCLGAALFSIAVGMARERSESVYTAILFHWFCIGLYWAWLSV